MRAIPKTAGIAPGQDFFKTSSFSPSRASGNIAARPFFAPVTTRSGAKFFTFLPIDSPIMGWFMICLAP